MTDERITQEEIIAMFGEWMPIEAAQLIFNADDGETVGEVRAKLRAISERSKTDERDIVERLRDGDQMDGRTVDCKHDLCNCAIMDEAADIIEAERKAREDERANNLAWEGQQSKRIAMLRAQLEQAKATLQARLDALDFAHTSMDEEERVMDEADDLIRATFASLNTSKDVEPEVCRIEHDGFEGTIQGRYTTREGKRGVVLQQIGTRVIHVYGEKWLNTSKDTQEATDDRT